MYMICMNDMIWKIWRNPRASWLPLVARLPPATFTKIGPRVYGPSQNRKRFCKKYLERIGEKQLLFRIHVFEYFVTAVVVFPKVILTINYYRYFFFLLCFTNFWQYRTISTIFYYYNQIQTVKFRVHRLAQ